uniref:Uncharacterized protein n=1 Tax=Anguilla anguilla TaxID=7936 RepID=A0A0E9T915_ANGAN
MGIFAQLAAVYPELNKQVGKQSLLDIVC